MAYKLTQQLTSGMYNRGVLNTTDVDDIDSKGVRRTQREINADIYSKLPSSDTAIAGITKALFDSETNEIKFTNNDDTVICTLDATPFLNDIAIDDIAVEDAVIDNETVKCLVFKFNDENKENINIPLEDLYTQLEPFLLELYTDVNSLKDSRLFREQNGGLKTSEVLRAFGKDSFAEGKGIYKAFELREDYIPETNYIFLLIEDNVGQNITIGSKLYYPKKVETTTVLSKSLKEIYEDSFLTLELESAFVKDINAGENVYVKINDEYVPIEVVDNYTAGDTEINVNEDAFYNIEDGATLYANVTDDQYATKTVTGLEHYHEGIDYEAIKVYIDSPIEYNLNATDTIYIESGIASGEGSHAEGLGSIAKGDFSHASGVFTNTTNEGEFACGNRNVSTPNVTLFSVGIGGQEQDKCDHLNAFEINKNGDLYIKGTGGYDGTNVTGTGIKSVQEILSEAGNAALEARVSAIEARFVQEIIDKITGGISFTLGNLYAGYPKTVTATGTVSLPPEVTADKITSIKLVGNGQTVEESGQTSVNIQNSVTAPQTYTLTASIAAPYIKTISKTATVNQVCPIYIALVDSNIDTAAKVIAEIAKVDNLYSPNSPLSNIKSITNKAFTYAANQRLAFICGQSGIRVKQVGGLADDPYTVNGESTTINGMTAYVYLTGTQQAGTRNITFNP